MPNDEFVTVSTSMLHFFTLLKWSVAPIPSKKAGAVVGGTRVVVANCCWLSVGVKGGLYWRIARREAVIGLTRVFVFVLLARSLLALLASAWS